MDEIYLEFSKTFGTISHSIGTVKLERQSSWINLCPAVLSVYSAERKKSTFSTGVAEVLYEDQGREHEGTLICSGPCPLLLPGRLAWSL